MQFNSMQLEAAHQLGEAILRFLSAMDSWKGKQPSDRDISSSKSMAVNLGDKRLLRASEVAQMLSLSRGMVYQLMHSGRLPSVQIGTARRFRLSDVKKILENGSPR